MFSGLCTVFVVVVVVVAVVAVVVVPGFHPIFARFPFSFEFSSRPIVGRRLVYFFFQVVRST